MRTMSRRYGRTTVSSAPSARCPAILSMGVGSACPDREACHRAPPLHRLSMVPATAAWQLITALWRHLKGATKSIRKGGPRGGLNSARWSRCGVIDRCDGERGRELQDSLALKTGQDPVRVSVVCSDTFHRMLAPVGSDAASAG